MSLKENVKKIRKIIKERCPTVSVKMGRGTIYGWATISPKGRSDSFTQSERACLKHEFNLRPAGNYDSLSPKRVRELIKKKRLEWGYNP